MHGRNFIRRSLLVKQHGAILGMQMRWNRPVGTNILAQARRSGECNERTRNLEIPRCAIAHLRFDAEPVIGSAKRPAPLASPRNDGEEPPVNAFLTIKRAKIA